MNMVSIIEFLHRGGVERKYNKNGNNCKFYNRRMPLSSSIECSADARIEIEGVTLRPGCVLRVRDGGRLMIGDHVAFNNNCIVTCRKEIIIEENTNIGPNCAIFDHDHDYLSSDRFSNYINEPIHIGRNVWIGANVTILKGSSIGDNCVIGAGTVVKGNLKRDFVYVGNPCRAVKEISRVI